MTRTLIVDGDIPVFQFAATAQKVTFLPIIEGESDVDEEYGGTWFPHADPIEAINGIDQWLAKLKADLEADVLLIALSHKDNFRYGVLESYKHNRKGSVQPMLRPVLKQYLLDNYECRMFDNLEGDDVLGILATDGKGDDRIMVTIDKDLRTVPGKHYNWNHAKDNNTIGEIFKVTEAEADHFHLLQVLAGDATDGYKGCDGIGMVTAEKILSDDPHIMVGSDYEITRGKRKGEIELRYTPEYGDYTPWETIVSYYEKAGQSEVDALQQARVAHICRAEDYNQLTNEVTLWQP